VIILPLLAFCRFAMLIAKLFALETPSASEALHPSDGHRTGLFVRHSPHSAPTNLHVLCQVRERGAEQDQSGREEGLER
jgi:hypothetical protein